MQNEKKEALQNQLEALQRQYARLQKNFTLMAKGEQETDLMLDWLNEIRKKINEIEEKLK